MTLAPPGTSILSSINSLRLSRLRFRISRIGQGIDWRTFLIEPITKVEARAQTVKLSIKPSARRQKRLQRALNWSTKEVHDRPKFKFLHLVRQIFLNSLLEAAFRL